MNLVRAFVTFLIVLMVVLLAIFQMRIRGYEEVDRLNEYVLYYNEEQICQDALYSSGDIEYRIECESQYIVKSGFAEYTVVEALQEEMIQLDDIEPYIRYTIE